MLKNEVNKIIQYELQFGNQRQLYHYNCAEAILLGANSYYNLQLDPRNLKIIKPFGGGMNTGNTCGILTGGIAAIGAIFAEDMPSLNHTMKEATKHWTEQFENRFKNTNCTQIKQLNQIGNEGCAHLILQAADLLQQVIEKYKGNKTTQ